MQKTLTLNTKLREKVGKEQGALRKQGLIPAVLYGHGVQNQNLSVDYILFEKVYGQAGESSLIDLVVGKEEPVRVLIQDIQTDPLTDKFIHVDFRKVVMTEKIDTEIALTFAGEAPAVKELGGTLIKSLSALRVRCLPGDLVREIEVDISLLRTFDDIIRVKDLPVPDNIEILENKEDAVISVSEPKKEEEKPVEEVVGRPEEVEISTERKKKEEEAEGAPALHPKTEKTE